MDAYLPHQYYRSLNRMKLIIAIIRPTRLSSVKDALKEHGFSGITITPVKGRGSQRGTTEKYRGSEYTIDLLDKVEIKVVVDDDDLEEVVKIITENARTGELGDGKIFILNIEQTIRIRTEEIGTEALG